jgi:DNA-binding NarL/FixJ family response regulator
MVRRRRPRCPDAIRLADGGIAIEGGGTINRRQIHVLDCVAAGLTNDDIADDLGISRSTVSRDIGHLLQATGLANRMALAACWVEIAARLRAAHATGS